MRQLRAAIRLVWMLGVALAAVGAPPAAAGPPLEDSVRDYRGGLPVFPGAEGFGSLTAAGRGGRILRVTNLDDSGPGSLRAALGSRGPRTVIFEVGGVIRLRDNIEVAEPFLTVAGQTAPTPGITLAGDTLRIKTHDVLLQHVRVRVGDGRANSEPEYRDGLGAATNRRGSFDTFNVFFDHCSVSWAIDENVSIWFDNVYDVTMSRGIIAEGLDDSLHPQGDHSMGMLAGKHSRRIAVVRNLFAHNGARNPRFSADSSGLVVNNLIYNVRHRAVDMGGDEGPSWLTAIGNVYLPGRDSRSDIKTVVVTNADPATRLYVADNTGPYQTRDPWSVVDNRPGKNIRSETPPVELWPLTIVSARKAKRQVLRTSGARPADRDRVDRRIVANVRLGQGGMIDSPAEVGGLGEVRPTRRPLQLPARPADDDDGDGYTNLEELLHCMAAKVERRRASGPCPGPSDGVSAAAAAGS